MVNVDGIKRWLGQSTNGEIRLGLKNAEDMGLTFDDRSIVDLFRDGIAVDVIIKKADSSDYIPSRLQRYLDNDSAWIDEGFVRVKIVDLSDGHSLNELEIAGLLMNLVDNDVKIATQLKEKDGFVSIRFTNVKKDRFLHLKEVRDILKGVLYSGDYEFIVEDIEGV